MISDAELIERARTILSGNWCDAYTKPAPRLYPHQWNWDSGFIALGYAAFAPERARSELRSLFRGQWRNGMVPHIVFHRPSRDYFPGPQVWKCEISQDAPREPQTSGLTNPPVHAIAVLRLLQTSQDKETKDFVRELAPRIRALHRYLYTYRDPGREGLAYTRHPWETGTDNSPTWDSALARIDLRDVALPVYRRKDTEIVSQEQRPTRADYDRYVYLIELYKRTKYDETAILQECPFLLQDPLFNAILCRANEALIEIADALGEDSAETREWLEQTRRGIEAKLWDDEQGIYAAFDLKANALVPGGSASGFLPLWAGVPRADRARRLVQRLRSPAFSGHEGSCYRVPSYDTQSVAFEPAKYWRGPVWVNMNWMIHHGLRRYGFFEEAAALRRDMRELVSRYGFYEYFGPFRNSGDGVSGGLGSPDFSWTAALSLDLLSEEDRDG